MPASCAGIHKPLAQAVCPSSCSRQQDACRAAAMHKLPPACTAPEVRARWPTRVRCPCGRLPLACRVPAGRHLQGGQTGQLPQVPGVRPRRHRVHAVSMQGRPMCANVLTSPQCTVAWHGTARHGTTEGMMSTCCRPAALAGACRQPLVLSAAAVPALQRSACNHLGMSPSPAISVQHVPLTAWTEWDRFVVAAGREDLRRTAGAAQPTASMFAMMHDVALLPVVCLIFAAWSVACPGLVT